MLQALSCSAPAGSPKDCAVLLPQALRPIPASLRVGSSDPLRGYLEADSGRLERAGWARPGQLSYSEFLGGHTVSVADAEAAWAWFAPRRRPH